MVKLTFNNSEVQDEIKDAFYFTKGQKFLAHKRSKVSTACLLQEESLLSYLYAYMYI